MRRRTSLYGKGMRYKVRYLDPDGQERSKTFPDKQKARAEDFLRDVEADVRRGSYIDPDAGKVLFRDFAQNWLDGQTFEETSRQSTESRLNSMVLPYFGGKELGAIKPTDVRAWVRWMQSAKKESSYQSVCFTHVSAILTAAVDDKLISENPCLARSVTRPRPGERKVVPWTRATVKKVRLALPDRYKIIVPVGAGAGLRQGEVFGLGVDAIDRDAMVLNVVRQVREVRGRLVFALPKRARTRDVPLSAGLLRLLDDYLEQFPPVPVTLPWSEPDGKPVTVRLILTTDQAAPLDRRRFGDRVWHNACRKAGITNPTREDGMHALRHHYASVLLDAGESIKALSEYLGHKDPGFTLRTYTHLMPSSAERTRRAIDEEWGSGDDGPAASDGLQTA
ncbi:tyrosine-type recombinase/integrase [Prauserella marina]|uniref:tyrosine-type recombinase/integrase n=1 Tax=Prauserella marina TaxID=530584 RepID=UPI00201146DA|nr:site-specific integrase [Prauserella marina]